MSLETNRYAQAKEINESSSTVNEARAAHNAEAAIRQQAAEMESRHPQGVYLFDPRGNRRGPFGGECLVQFLASHPGCREAYPGDGANLCIGPNGEAVPAFDKQ